jgi:toxin ParE1/3/4
MKLGKAGDRTQEDYRKSVKQYTVIFTPEAQEQLAEFYHYIAVEASPAIADRYTNAIVSYCESLHTFPLRGTCRDDIRPGLRITNYKKRTVIAFNVDAGIHHWSVLRWAEL